MPEVKVIAKMDNLPYFKKDDKLTIIPILYEEDTLLVNEIHGIFKNGEFVKIFEKTDLNRDLRGLEIKKIEDKLFAPKGSYKDSVIENNIGVRYPSFIVRCYQDYFEKV